MSRVGSSKPIIPNVTENVPELPSNITEDIEAGEESETLSADQIPLYSSDDNSSDIEIGYQSRKVQYSDSWPRQTGQLSLYQANQAYFYQLASSLTLCLGQTSRLAKPFSS